MWAIPLAVYHSTSGGAGRVELTLTKDLVPIYHGLPQEQGYSWVHLTGLSCHHGTHRRADPWLGCAVKV